MRQARTPNPSSRAAPLWLVLSVMLTGCPRAPSAPAEPSPTGTQAPKPALATSASSAPIASTAAPPPDAAAEPEGPPALSADEALVMLSVEGHGDAVVSLPLGARAPRPIVLATHGNYDSPEWQCEIWRGIVLNDAFVLCPRGTARGDSPSRSDLRYHYLTNKVLEKEIDAAVDALQRRYPDYVDVAGMIYTGFSQGAIMGASIMLRHPERYPRAVLIEGGNREWNVGSAKAFAAGGGKRLLFGCGQWNCLERSQSAGRSLARANIPSRIAYAKAEGHTYGGGVAVEVFKAFDWLVEDDPRWDERRARAATEAAKQNAGTD